MPKIRKICAECGSENVVADAWAEWDEYAQDWVLANVFDYEFCQACESETTIKNIEAIDRGDV